MAKKRIEKGTIYQQLNKFFNVGVGFDNIQKTDFDQAKTIIKGTSPQDIERKALELQQKKQLQDKFFRTTDRGFQKALQYEAARLPAYIDYEGFEYYPLIATALDLFMEEATTIGDNGKMLNIYSNKDRIKHLLEELFYDIANVNVNLPFWTRNMCKYGDNFVLHYGEKGKGVTHIKQLVNYEIERYERIQDGKPTIKFKDRMTGDEFNIFEISHFRLLGDDKFLPYGSSVLNKVRRVTRQLIMAEDAMLTYRIVRAGEKKVFKIDVGNIDDDDIEDYVYKIATKFKRIPQVNPNSGQIDYRFNILGNDEDYFLPVRSANTQTGIDTLPGASNLDAIQDIEYLRDNLFTGLGIPKPFLSFQDAAGGGKNMAQYDIRFTKKINRIQQAMIQELNKMAIIHLYLLGYRDEDLGNFTLTLTNPSTQHELLKAELMRERAQTYRDLTSTDSGIAPMSHTQAKRYLFNMTDKEIIEDLKQQKMEMTIKQELQDSPIVIKKSGLFRDIDAKYGEDVDESEMPPPEGEEGGGGPDLGGGGPDLGGGPGGGIEAAPGPPPGGGLGDLPGLSERTDNKKKMSFNEFSDYIDSYMNKTDNFKDDEKESIKSIINESNNNIKTHNDKAKSIITEIDDLLKNETFVTKKQTEDVDEFVNDLDDLDLDEEKSDD